MYRGYENGLAYFFAHPEKFKGLGRFELNKLHPGVSKKLRREGNLEKAIPEKRVSGRPSLFKTELGRILMFYLIHDGNASEIARQIRHTTPPVCKCLWKVGLKPKGKKGRRRIL